MSVIERTLLNASSRASLTFILNPVILAIFLETYASAVPSPNCCVSVIVSPPSITFGSVSFGIANFVPFIVSEIASPTFAIFLSPFIFECIYTFLLFQGACRPS